jgi:hypothetical protein
LSAVNRKTICAGERTQVSAQKKGANLGHLHDFSAQYNGTFGSTVRAQPSTPPRIDWTFSNPCCRNQFVTVSERTP